MSTKLATMDDRQAPAGWQVTAQAAPKRLPTEEGVWIFIFGDLVVFAFFFAMFLVYRAHEPELFRLSQQALHPNTALINTLLLLTSSLFVVFGMRAVHGRRPDLASKLFLGGVAWGSGFVVLKALEYRAALEAGFTPMTNDFWFFYYMLTGFHLFHLVLGLGVLVSLAVLARRPTLSVKQLAFVEGGACFWHMVDLVWIVMFPLLYLVR